MMRSVKQLQQILEAQAQAIRCRLQLIASNNENIALIDQQSMHFQDAIYDIRRCQHQAQFELMNQLSYRRFMRYMRKHHGWR